LCMPTSLAARADENPPERRTAPRGRRRCTQKPPRGLGLAQGLAVMPGLRLQVGDQRGRKSVAPRSIAVNRCLWAVLRPTQAGRQRFPSLRSVTALERCAFGASIPGASAPDPALKRRRLSAPPASSIGRSVGRAAATPRRLRGGLLCGLPVRPVGGRSGGAQTATRKALTDRRSRRRKNAGRRALNTSSPGR
jgi:hypothetical protein